MPEQVCMNTSCKSYGQVHPNCRCYAEGGCVGPHMEKCEHYADGGQIGENINFQNDPVDALDHAAVQHGLLGLMTKLGISKSDNPGKHHTDFLNHSKKGKKTLKHHTDNVMHKEHKVPHEPSSVDALKEQLQSIQEKPDQLLNLGGFMATTLPDHAVQLAAKVGTAISYLNRLKPPRELANPLDTPEPPDKAAEAHYNRHLSIAQNPMLIVQHVKDGTLRPDDVVTLKTLYPSLSKSISSNAYEQLVNAKHKGVELPYKQKQALSILLGQPLDSSMTPQSMQAIINSQGPQQSKLQAKAQPKKASSVEINQINKVNNLDDTVLQDRMKDKLEKD